MKKYELEAKLNNVYYGLDYSVRILVDGVEADGLTKTFDVNSFTKAQSYCKYFTQSYRDMGRTCEGSVFVSVINYDGETVETLVYKA